MLPEEVGTAALVLAMIAALAGVGLWLLGAKFSRGLITLSLVSIGASIGMKLPEWFDWHIAGWATGLLGALLLGVAGYALHRFWVGVGLGLVLACWAGLATWTFAHGDDSWRWPAVDRSTTAASFLSDLWNELPNNVTQILPFAAGAALVSGISVAVLWPRVGIVVLYSLTGVSILISMLLLAIETGRPSWVSRLPEQTWAQVLVLAVLVGIGAFVQWKLGLANAVVGGGGAGGSPKGPKPPSKKK